MPCLTTPRQRLFWVVGERTGCLTDFLPNTSDRSDGDNQLRPQVDSCRQRISIFTKIHKMSRYETRSFNVFMSFILDSHVPQTTHKHAFKP